jgi:hypothetical protein
VLEDSTGGTPHRSVTSSSLLSFGSWSLSEPSLTVTDYIFKILRSINEAILLGLAFATNALEACTTKRLLREVGCTPAPSICPEGNVRLHELCKACTLFTRCSVAPGWLDGSNPHSDWPPRERYRLCTVAHLRRLNERCHFCTALYYFVLRLESSTFGKVGTLDNRWLYLCIQPDHKPWKQGSVQFSARLYPQELHFKAFELHLLAGM